MIELKPLVSSDREQFIKDNQEAFNYGALEEFGLRDDHFEEDGRIISRETIEESIDSGEAYRILDDGKVVGGVVVRIEGDRGDLDLLFVSPKCHSKGVGYGAWCQIEKMFPQVKIWETVTPYFEKRNIHFYVNRCGFKIVEFFNSHHKYPNDDEASEMFRFEKHL
ncbi:GNAT family N-acetyltransferase [Streptococcus equinus]|uniref:GNAT family N-acetyltransferase n=1 Tax=Streptococcus equinus TaxID=1335 RepID=UPI000886BD2A|nr:GNAT family N-acetyltransferase [Streptococcus equinus]SDQ23368.1 Acetyltransferase (GNAT) domain-containing protein [Streptococcus equinus]